MLETIQRTLGTTLLPALVQEAARNPQTLQKFSPGIELAN